MRTAFVALAVAILAAPGPREAAARQMAGAQMPDPRQMSGVPLPSPELPAGTMTVRLVQGSLDKPIAGMTVELAGTAASRAETDEAGRATFAGLPAGARVKAVALVGSERLESQEIQVPASGGVRVMLVATDPGMEERAEEDRRLAEGPAQRGTVVIGGESRFVFELGDDGLNVFNLMQIVNTARVPIDTGGPVAFDLPQDAERPALMDGSSPLATLAGRRIEVKGPFPPGASLVQFAYTLPYSGDSATIRQVLPVPMTQLLVIAQKVGAMRLTSPQMTQHGDREAEGQTYVVGRGPAIPAGGAVEFAFTGLPHNPLWPRNLALVLVVLILGAGAFYSIGATPQAARAAERTRLEARRERLFAELTALEDSHRAGRMDPAHYTARRQQLIASLERVYAALDGEAAA